MRLSAVFNLYKHVLSLAKVQVLHKMEHLSLSFFKKMLVRGGLSLLVITLVWEIIEDVIFPACFWALGRWIHPAFYAGIPVSWMLCLHWIAVPALWGAWMRHKGKSIEPESLMEHDHSNNSC